MNFSCPHCGLALNGNACGGVYSCPRCLGQFQIPTPVVEPPVMPVIEAGSGMPAIVDRPSRQTVRYTIETEKKPFWTGWRIVWTVSQPLIWFMLTLGITIIAFKESMKDFDRGGRFEYYILTLEGPLYSGKSVPEKILNHSLVGSMQIAALLTFVVFCVVFYLLGHKKTLVITSR